MNLHKTVSLSIRLDASEQFKFETPTGPILVNHLRFTPSSFDKGERFRNRTAHARGNAIKVDGSMALINRDGYIPFSDIPPHILEAAVNEFNTVEKVSL